MCENRFALRFGSGVSHQLVRDALLPAGAGWGFTQGLAVAEDGTIPVRVRHAGTEFDVVVRREAGVGP